MKGNKKITTFSAALVLSSLLPVLLLSSSLAAFFVSNSFSFYEPAVLLLAAPNPGNVTTSASNNVFQTDTFSVKGPMSSLVLSARTDPQIIAGSWKLDVEGGNVTNFRANLTIISSNGTGRHTLHLENFKSFSNNVMLERDGSTLIIGSLDVSSGDGKKEWYDVDAAIQLAKFQAISITLIISQDIGNPLSGQTVFGIVDQEEEKMVEKTKAITTTIKIKTKNNNNNDDNTNNTAAATTDKNLVISEGSGLMFNNATKKFRLPELPNPFR